jgi:hypothetical protein
MSFALLFVRSPKKINVHLCQNIPAFCRCLFKASATPRSENSGSDEELVLIKQQEQNKWQILSRVQMKSWAGEAWETVNCCAFLKSRLIGVC